jgi:biopolymer transport protein ExbB/TolQ/prefoldin subunit 5
MNKITIIEFLLVGLIILIQIIQTLKTFKKINVLKSIIPNKDFFKIKLFNIPVEDLQVFQPKDVLDNLSKYELETLDRNSKPITDDFEYIYENLEPLTITEIKDRIKVNFSENIKATLKEEIIEEAIAIHNYYENYDNSNEKDSFVNEISLINPNETSNTIFEGLLHSINVYLLRNKGATTDFNLIKDITERNIDTEDEDISQRITTPLYLGLMGTMLGIIFGLINLFLVSGNGDEFEIQGFLIGVSIAMSASFIGLLFTVLNSTYYKTARKNVEVSKNDFYTFIQTELLPILNQSVSSSVFMLHTNLVKFNDNFTVNINRLTGLLNKNYDAVIAQDNILQSLENIDITEFAKANIKVLRELKAGTEDLHKFNQYLSSLNSTVDGTTRLSNSFQTLLNKVNNFEGLAEKLDSRIEESNKLVQFLNDHYEVLSERGDLLTDSVKKVDDVLNKSLVELREHTIEKIDAIKEITIKEEDLMTKAFADNRSHFSKLSLLENLNQSINDIKSNSNSQIGSVNTQINLLKESLDKTNAVLDEINNKSFTQNVAKSFKNIFSSKNK